MRRVKKIKLFHLVAIIFLTISGGPYGLESLLSYVGNYWALILLLITPILWDLPTIFTVLELNSLMPINGGYYQWVKRAMGLRFAWYEGWWTWLYTFIDLAIYPVLIMEYLSYLFPEVGSFRIPICLFIVWSCAYLNIRGIMPVGRAAIIFGCIVLIPFIILFVCYLTHPSSLFILNTSSSKEIKFPALGLGLYTVMWNFLGWDNVTTYAEEVSKPIRTYFVSVIISFFIIISIYFLVLIVSIYSGIDHHILSKVGFPALGELIGGRWLGQLIALGGLASGVGLYFSVLLSVSRVPEAMSEDKLLPKKLHSLHPKFQTPYISIISCSIIVSFFILFSFSHLLIMDVIVYGAALFLEFASLIILRIKIPNENRPFKLPLNIPGLILMISLPVMVYFIALIGAIFDSENSIKPVLLALLCLISGEVLWRVIVYRNPNLKHDNIYKNK
jgi:amino acid transporter